MLKYLIIMLLLVSGIAVNAQTNTSPYNSMDFCNSDSTIVVDVNESFDIFTTQSFENEPCDGGQTTLFYSHYLNTQSGGTEWYVAYAGGAIIDFVVYGPFSNVEEGESLVANNTAPIRFSASGDSVSIYGPSINNSYYILKLTINACSGELTIMRSAKMQGCGIILPPCSDCLPTFEPKDKTFIISAWVHESDETAVKTTFAMSSISVTTGTGTVDFYPSGQIIDGWQRIEGTFLTDNTSSITIGLTATGDSDVYFDDIRIFPFDGSMMSYVYDPLTLRLVAELDERNYAKLYEYDEEGKLVRVKKETVKGIMTIQENRENSSLK